MNNSDRITEIYKCEVCDSESLVPVLNLGLNPLCDDLVEIEERRVCEEYPIEILFCEKCDTAHQKYQINKNHLFPAEYNYRSRFTNDVLKGMQNLVIKTKDVLGDLNCKNILDIGCNDGSLLDCFSKEGAKTFGIDPTNAVSDANPNHIIINDYFSIETAKNIKNLSKGCFDVITFTNVFAHIENLKEVLNCLKLLMDDKTILIIENHYLGAVLDKNQFDTFYHEHPRTYSFNSFRFIAESLGRDIIDCDFPSRYGGNIRVIIGGGQAFHEIKISEVDYLKKFQNMRKFIDSWRISKKKEIVSLNAKYGRLPAKAFPGRAAILIKLLDLDETNILKAYEKPGSKKIGKYIPGTKIPIESDEQFFDSKDNYPVILNFAWHISDEIISYMRDENYTGEIVNIL